MVFYLPLLHIFEHSTEGTLAYFLFFIIDEPSKFKV